MTKQEAYEAGLKLIGVYFIVSGISTLAMSILGLCHYVNAARTIDGPVFKIILQSLLHPGIQLTLATILLKKTNSIVDKLNR